MSTNQQQSLARPAPAPRPPSGMRIQRRCACGTHSPGGETCSDCAKKKQTQQRRAGANSAFTPEDPSMDAEASAAFDTGGGRPLEPAVAARYRPGLGSLIDRVRIHDDSAANATTLREGAVAFTSGASIFFAPNAYRPHSPAGRNLLSHELAHVWQQHRPDGPPAGYQSRPNDRYEQEADRMAESEAFTVPASLRTPEGSIRQRRSAAEQIASEIRTAVDGWGTDEQAIFNALAGRSPAEIADIEKAYLALSGGETLEARLRDELSGDDLSRAMSMLRGESAATEAARQIWNAVRGWGTDEESIYAALSGRSTEQWIAIQDAYKQVAGEDLIARLQDELSDGEWKHLRSLLPGAEGGAATDEDRATVAANQIQHAVDGLGTDEEAIFSALTGRSAAELAEIQKRYKLLTGEDMMARLRDELNDSDFAGVQLLYNPDSGPTRYARALHDAMQGLGTDESAIMAILTGRPAAELPLIRLEYQRLYSEALTDRLKDELSGDELNRALTLLNAGVLDAADEIHLAVAGLGTDEERLFAVLTEISANQATVVATVASYAAKGYGDMLADIRGDLSGDELARAMELLHGKTPTASCSADERRAGLESISGAASLAQNAVGKLDVDIAAGKLSGSISSALTDNFNGGGAAGAATVALAGLVRPILNSAYNDLMSSGTVTCATPAPMPCGTVDPCAAKPDCSAFTAAWTCKPAGSIVRLCPAFFSCSDDRPTTMLHEFVHHTGVTDKQYHHQAGFSTLTPQGNGSASDSLSNADSFAYFAKALY
ncbi:MAG: DUF4157 domain-containing protein [Sphingomonas sp.]